MQPSTYFFLIEIIRNMALYRPLEHASGADGNCACSRIFQPNIYEPVILPSCLRGYAKYIVVIHPSVYFFSFHPRTTNSPLKLWVRPWDTKCRRFSFLSLFLQREIPQPTASAHRPLDLISLVYYYRK